MVKKFKNTARTIRFQFHLDNADANHIHLNLLDGVKSLKGGYIK